MSKLKTSAESISLHDWHMVQALIEQVKKEEEALTTFESQLSLFRFSVRWFKKVEESNMIDRTPGSIDLHYHSMLCNGLLSIGESLHIYRHKNNLSLECVEELNLLILELKNSLDGWHSTLSPKIKKTFADKLNW